MCTIPTHLIGGLIGCNNCPLCPWWPPPLSPAHHGGEIVSSAAGVDIVTPRRGDCQQSVAGVDIATPRRGDCQQCAAGVDITTPQRGDCQQSAAGVDIVTPKKGDCQQRALVSYFSYLSRLPVALYYLLL